MRKLALFAALFSCQAAAGDLWLQLNGVSYHPDSYDCTSTTTGMKTCNENNSGFGFQYDASTKGDKTTSYVVGTLINSFRQRSYYVGGFSLYGNQYAKIGYFYGVMRYPNDGAVGDTIPAILPVAAFKYGNVGINVTYLYPAWFVQAQIRIGDF